MANAQFFQVSLRVRALLKSEDCEVWNVQGNKLVSVGTLDAGELAKVQPKERKRALSIDHQEYTYDSIECDPRTQSLYVKLCRPLVRQALLGYHVTVLCYGQTTSGKTYTSLGDPRNPGVIPCTLKDVFAWKRESDVSVWVQYLQIYNEVLDDLLCPSSKPTIVDDPKWGATVQGAEKIRVNQFEDAIKLMNQGEENRIYRATKIHDHSSRSHTVFKIYIQVNNEKEATYACINLIDLAGSERLTDSDTNTQNETGYINKSLFTLTNVINKLAEKQKHIPFRDSKLTRLLTDALGGNSKTLLICCVSPARRNFFQTLGTLKFANQAKLIRNTPIKGVTSIEDGEVTALRSQLEASHATIEEMKEQIRHLRVELSSAQMANTQMTNTQMTNTLSNTQNTQNSQMFNPMTTINISDMLEASREVCMDAAELNELIKVEQQISQSQLKLNGEALERLTDLSGRCCDHNVQRMIWLLQTQFQSANLLGKDWNEFVQYEDIVEKVQLPTSVASFRTQIEQIKQQTEMVLRTLYTEAQILKYTVERRKEQVQMILGIERQERASDDSLDDKYRESVDRLNSIVKQINEGLSMCKDTINDIGEIVMQSDSRDYAVYVCGSNQDGRLGIGSGITIVRSPQQLERSFKQISCGSHHTVGVTSDGSLYSWGRGQRGQLGLGGNVSVDAPQRVTSLSRIARVKCGWQHTLALDSAGKLFSWGYGEDGQLGLGDTQSHNTPQTIQGFKGQDIWAGHSTSGFLTLQNQLHCFGSNWDGRCMLDRLQSLCTPQLVLTDKVRYVSMGVSHMGVIMGNGQLIMSGVGTEGQLGTVLDSQVQTFMVQSESETEDVASTGVVVDLDGCVQVECGDRYTLVLTQEGVVYSFGKGSYARLGLGNEDTYIPTRIPSLKHITSIAAGFRHSAALDSGGRVYLWGFNFHNQLGLGENDQDQVIPIQLNLHSRVRSLSLGYFHTIFTLI